MKRFFQSLMNMFATPNKSRPSQPQRRAALNVEVLENRLVPSASYLNLAGQHFTLEGNNGQVTGTVSVVTENQATGAFTGTFVDATANHLGVVEKISGQLSATSQNIFGQKFATIDFTGQGSAGSIIRGETESVDFAGRVTKDNGKLELLGDQDVQDLYHYETFIVTNGHEIVEQQSVSSNPHEFVSSDFQQSSSDKTLSLPSEFNLTNDSGTPAGKLVAITPVSPGSTVFTAIFVNPAGVDVNVTGELSLKGHDAFGQNDVTVSFAGSSSTSTSLLNVNFNGRVTQNDNKFSLAGELETSGYRIFTTEVYNPILHRFVTDTVELHFDNVGFAYAEAKQS